MTVLQEDHWSASAYQNSAAFVPKLATKVLGWLDVGADDVILDVGCGDGILNLQIAEVLKKGKGKIHGIDSSEAMIAAAKRDAKAAGVEEKCTFEVFDATSGPFGTEQYDKVFSNAAMHWILRPVEHRDSFFRSIHSCLKRNGTFVFEMGGMGNVGEMRTALLSVISRRVGIQKTREIDPWFFPDEVWMTRMLEVTVGGFKVERIEREFRPTRATEGEGEGVGIRGWVVFMGKQFFDVIEDKEERGRCVDEVVELLGSVCASPGGGDWIGYVRLRAIVRKV